MDKLLFAKKAMWYYSFIDFYTRSLFHLEWTKSSSNRFNFAGYTSKTTLTSRCLLYYCILASSIFFRLSCHTLISEIILHRPTFKWHWQLYFHLDPEATIPTCMISLCLWFSKHEHVISTLKQSPCYPFLTGSLILMIFFLLLYSILLSLLWTSSVWIMVGKVPGTV